MKKFRIFLKFLLLALVLLGAIAFLFVRSLRPDYDGERILQGLQDSVSVYYDTYGIPHIFADNEADAFRALGYVHAQDRLWQMELLRRIARGGISEVFGPDFVDTDRFFLTLGIDQATEALLEVADTRALHLQLAQAYLDGVNAFIDQGPTPPEFYLTGLEKTHFEMRDIYNAVGYMAFSFAMAHKTDPFLEEVGRTLPEAYIRELLDEAPEATTRIRNFMQTDSTRAPGAIASALRNILDPLPIPPMEGSNSWVIGPSKTRSGSVILANDPHIGFAQPSVWFEAHIRTPRYEKYGYHLAGIPFPLLGHDRNLAYGLTMFENDDIDFYQETTDPSDSTRYRRPEGWKTLEQVTRSIRVKGGEAVSFTYSKTDKGPILNEVLKPLKGQPPVSMSWVYTQGENKVLEALFGISHASNLPSFAAAVEQIHAPGLNVMYGDAQGNVAWWAAARLYSLPDSSESKRFLPGAEAGSEFARVLPFEANPKSVNPPWGYVYSANNQPDSTALAGYVPGYYLPENRARRIVSLLEGRSDWDRTGVEGMITDGVSQVNAEVVRALSRHIDVRQLDSQELHSMDVLSSWSGEYLLSGKEGLLYHRWIYYLLQGAFADELGPEGFQALLATHLHKRLIARMAERPGSVWWDNVRTEAEETMADIVNQSFRDALASVERDFGTESNRWNWGEVHTLEHHHPMGQVAALRRFFNVGPFPAPASREVINNLAFQYDSTGVYPVTSGPSTRRIIDFSDVENSVSILPTGQSGNPLSPHYDDQAEMYIHGEFRKMLMNPTEIRETASHVLEFHPPAPQ